MDIRIDHVFSLADCQSEDEGRRSGFHADVTPTAENKASKVVVSDNIIDADLAAKTANQIVMGGIFGATATTLKTKHSPGVKVRQRRPKRKKGMRLSAATSQSIKPRNDDANNPNTEITPLHDRPADHFSSRDTDVPPILEIDVPPSLENDVPPSRENDVPPSLESDVPPSLENDVPPSGSDADVSPSLDSDMPPLLEADVPPSLQCEKNCGALSTVYFDTTREVMDPPVLSPAEKECAFPATTAPPRSGDRPGKRNLPSNSTPIEPCYIVLSCVNPYLHPKTYTSYRNFKRTYRECTNMCKKIHFRRQLKVGKDLFNVKAPSRTKDYQYYVWKEEKRARMIRMIKQKSSSRPVAELQDQLKKDAQNKQEKQTAKAYTGRIRRYVAHVPKDFIEQLKHEKESELKKHLEEEELLEQLICIQNLEKQIKADVEILKRQVEKKRSAIKRVKKPKPSAANEQLPFYMKGGTISFCGRQRKANPKYGDEFARTEREVNHCQLIAVVAESIRKQDKLKQETPQPLKRNVLPKRKRKRQTVASQLLINSNELPKDETKPETPQPVKNSGDLARHASASNNDQSVGCDVITINRESKLQRPKDRENRKLSSSSGSRKATKRKLGNNEGSRQRKRQKLDHKINIMKAKSKLFFPNTSDNTEISSKALAEAHNDTSLPDPCSNDSHKRNADAHVKKLLNKSITSRRANMKCGLKSSTSKRVKSAKRLKNAKSKGKCMPIPPVDVHQLVKNDNMDESTEVENKSSCSSDCEANEKQKIKSHDRKCSDLNQKKTSVDEVVKDVSIDPVRDGKESLLPNTSAIQYVRNPPLTCTVAPSIIGSNTVSSPIQSLAKLVAQSGPKKVLSHENTSLLKCNAKSKMQLAVNANKFAVARVPADSTDNVDKTAEISNAQMISSNVRPASKKPATVSVAPYVMTPSNLVLSKVHTDLNTGTPVAYGNLTNAIMSHQPGSLQPTYITPQLVLPVQQQAKSNASKPAAPKSLLRSTTISPTVSTPTSNTSATERKPKKFVFVKIAGKGYAFPLADANSQTQIMAIEKPSSCVANPATPKSSSIATANSLFLASPATPNAIVVNSLAGQIPYINNSNPPAISTQVVIASPATPNTILHPTHQKPLLIKCPPAAMPFINVANVAQSVTQTSTQHQGKNLKTNTVASKSGVATKFVTAAKAQAAALYKKKPVPMENGQTVTVKRMIAKTKEQEEFVRDGSNNVNNGIDRNTTIVTSTTTRSSLTSDTMASSNTVNVSTAMPMLKNIKQERLDADKDSVGVSQINEEDNRGVCSEGSVTVSEPDVIEAMYTSAQPTSLLTRSASPHATPSADTHTLSNVQMAATPLADRNTQRTVQMATTLSADTNTHRTVQMATTPSADTNTHRTVQMATTPSADTNTHRTVQMATTPSADTNTHRTVQMATTPSADTNTLRTVQMATTPSADTNTQSNVPIATTPSADTNTHRTVQMATTPSADTNTHRTVQMATTPSADTNTQSNVPIATTPSADITTHGNVSMEEQHENDTVPKPVDEEKEKPKAFSESLTDRGEKLRKLKALLREKQKAVESIRVCTKKSAENGND